MDSPQTNMVAQYWHERALDLVKRWKLEAAGICFERALHSDPDRADIRANYANCLRRAWRFSEARSHARRALDQAPGELQIQAILGTLELDRNRPERAQALLEPAKTLSEFHRFCYAVSLLLGNRMADGFREYDARLTHTKPAYPLPLWKGEDLAGKTLAIAHEQGYGDTIMFSRFLAPLREKAKAEGFEVLFGAPSHLLRLFPEAHSVHSRLQADYMLPLMSLPSRLGMESLPPFKPYICPPVRFVFPRPAMTRLAVGIVWRSKSGGKVQSEEEAVHGQRKSIPLDLLLPLGGIPGVALYSLQMGDAAADLERFECGDLVRDLGSVGMDFADLAGFMEQMDLIVTIDSAPAHLAGAMGKPCIVLCNYIGSWQWQTGNRTPWYGDSLEIIRQTTPFDWQPVADRLRERVAQLAARPFGEFLQQTEPKVSERSPTE